MKSWSTIACILAIGANTYANSWTEKLTCEVKRTSETGGTINFNETIKFTVSGPHNAESGTVALVSSLSESYKVTFDLITSGRYDLKILTTTLKEDGSVVAKSSIFDTGTNETLSNTFVTDSGDYTVDIKCLNTTVW